MGGTGSGRDVEGGGPPPQRSRSGRGDGGAFLFGSRNSSRGKATKETIMGTAGPQFRRRIVHFGRKGPAGRRRPLKPPIKTRPFVEHLGRASRRGSGASGARLRRPVRHGGPTVTRGSALAARRSARRWRREEGRGGRGGAAEAPWRECAGPFLGESKTARLGWERSNEVVLREHWLPRPLLKSLRPNLSTPCGRAQRSGGGWPLPPGACPAGLTLALPTRGRQGSPAQSCFRHDGRRLGPRGARKGSDQGGKEAESHTS